MLFLAGATICVKLFGVGDTGQVTIRWLHNTTPLIMLNRALTPVSASILQFVRSHPHLQYTLNTLNIGTYVQYPLYFATLTAVSYVIT